MIRTLFVRPSHDDVTSYLHYFSRELVQESKSRGFNTIDKEKENSTRKIVTEVIKKNEPKFIMFNGNYSAKLEATISFFTSSIKSIPFFS